MRNIPCEVIEDLLPSYVDGLTSDASNLLIQEHMSSCEHCRETLAAMHTPLATIPAEQDAWKVDVLKKYRRRSRLVSGLAGAAIALAVLLVVGSYFRLIRYNPYRYYFADSAKIDTLAEIGDENELPDEVRLFRDLEGRTLYLYVEYENGHYVWKDLSSGTYRAGEKAGDALPFDPEADTY